MTDLDFKTIGKKIKQRRISQHITQEYIAGQLDVNPSHISNIECGRAHPSLTALIKIANILKCSVDAFINEEYNYQTDITEETLERTIIRKMNACDIETKQKLLKLFDIL